MNRYEKEVEEHSVKELLAVCCEDTNVDEEFHSLTKIMHYDEDRRKNFVEMFAMFEYLLESFSRTTTHEYNLELSYSHNDSTFQ